MLLTDAENLEYGDVIIVSDEEWEVMDVCESDTGLLISACKDGVYELFDHTFISSKQ